MTTKHCPKCGADDVSAYCDRDSGRFYWSKDGWYALSSPDDSEYSECGDCDWTGTVADLITKEVGHE